MTTYSSRFLGSFKLPQQRPASGAIDDESTYYVNFNRGFNESITGKRHHSYTHFKSAQW